MPNAHHFRVVNFDSNIREKEEVQGATGNAYSETKHYEGETVSETIGNLFDNNDAHTKLDNATTTHRIKDKARTSRTVKNINFRSSSDFFRNYRNSNALRSLSTKTWSFDDLRERLKNNVCGIKIRPNSLKKRFENNLYKKRHSAWYRNQDRSQDDIKVLYASERYKSRKDKGEYADVPRKVLPIKKSDSVKDGSIKKTYRKNTFLCYQTCRHIGLFPTPKRKKKKKESKTYILHTVQPLACKSNRRSQKPRISLNQPEHFSLVAFPFCESRKKSRTLPQHDIIWKSQTNTPEILKCEADNYSRVCIEPVTVPFNQCPGIVAAPCSAAQIYTQVSNLSCKEANADDEDLNCCSDILQPALKHFMVFVMIVVSLPCLIIGILIWLIVIHIRRQDTADQENLCNEHQSTCCVAKNNCCRFFRFISSKALNSAIMIKKVMNDEDISNCPRPQYHVLSMPRMSCQVKGMHRKGFSKNRCKWQPNPTKKYVLFYNSNRGWLIKPVRNQICNQFGQSDTAGWDVNKNCKHRTVTFCNGPDHSASNLDECTQVSYKVSKKKKPKCCKCSQRRRSIKTPPVQLRIPCPTSRPCPGHARKSMRAYAAIRKEAMRRATNWEHSKPRVQVCVTTNQSNFEGCAEKLTFRQRIRKCCREIKCGLVASDEEAWGEDLKCGSLYLSMLKNRPCFWIYECCPNFYPHFLTCHRLCSRFVRVCLFICAACVWCPVFFCTYLCYTLTCMLCCGGGCDCNC